MIRLRSACGTQGLKQLIFCLCIAVMLAGCGGNTKKEAKYPTGADRASTGGDIYAEPDSIFGPGGLKIMGNNKKEETGGGIGVNSFLWRASLDTVSFMPLASADPFGGVIITDWYAPPESPDERFKLNILILDRQLRSDGVKVRVFRQTRDKKGWKDAKASEETASKLEETILTRARRMRVEQSGL